jgi:hypothetical protein
MFCSDEGACVRFGIIGISARARASVSMSCPRSTPPKLLGCLALLVAADSFFNSRREQLVALAARYALPAVYEWREFAVGAGGFEPLHLRIGIRQH